MARLCEDLAATLLAGDQLHDALQPALLTSLPGVSCLSVALGSNNAQSLRPQTLLEAGSLRRGFPAATPAGQDTATWAAFASGRAVRGKDDGVCNVTKARFRDWAALHQKYGAASFVTVPLETGAGVLGALTAAGSLKMERRAVEALAARLAEALLRRTMESLLKASPRCQDALSTKLPGHEATEQLQGGGGPEAARRLAARFPQVVQRADTAAPSALDLRCPGAALAVDSASGEGGEGSSSGASAKHDATASPGGGGGGVSAASPRVGRSPRTAGASPRGSSAAGGSQYGASPFMPIAAAAAAAASPRTSSEDMRASSFETYQELKYYCLACRAENCVDLPQWHWGQLVDQLCSRSHRRPSGSLSAATAPAGMRAGSGAGGGGGAASVASPSHAVASAGMARMARLAALCAREDEEDLARSSAHSSTRVSSTTDLTHPAAQARAGHHARSFRRAASGQLKRISPRDLSSSPGSSPASSRAASMGIMRVGDSNLSLEAPSPPATPSHVRRPPLAPQPDDTSLRTMSAQSADSRSDKSAHEAVQSFTAGLRRRSDTHYGPQSSSVIGAAAAAASKKVATGSPDGADGLRAVSSYVDNLRRASRDVSGQRWPGAAGGAEPMSVGPSTLSVAPPTSQQLPPRPSGDGRELRAGSLRAGSVFEDDMARDAVAAYKAARAVPGAPRMGGQRAPLPSPPPLHLHLQDSSRTSSGSGSTSRASTTRQVADKSAQGVAAARSMVDDYMASLQTRSLAAAADRQGPATSPRAAAPAGRFQSHSSGSARSLTPPSAAIASAGPSSSAGGGDAAGVPSSGAESPGAAHAAGARSVVDSYLAGLRSRSLAAKVTRAGSGTPPPSVAASAAAAETSMTSEGSGGAGGGAGGGGPGDARATVDAYMSSLRKQSAAVAHARAYATEAPPTGLNAATSEEPADPQDAMADYMKSLRRHSVAAAAAEAARSMSAEPDRMGVVAQEADAKSRSEGAAAAAKSPPLHNPFEAVGGPPVSTAMSEARAAVTAHMEALRMRSSSTQSSSTTGAGSSAPGSRQQSQDTGAAQRLSASGASRSVPPQGGLSPPPPVSQAPVEDLGAAKAVVSTYMDDLRRRSAAMTSAAAGSTGRASAVPNIRAGSLRAGSTAGGGGLDLRAIAGAARASAGGGTNAAAGGAGGSPGESRSSSNGSAASREDARNAVANYMENLKARSGLAVGAGGGGGVGSSVRSSGSLRSGSLRLASIQLDPVADGGSVEGGSGSMDEPLQQQPEQGRKQESDFERGAAGAGGQPPKPIDDPVEAAADKSEGEAMKVVATYITSLRSASVAAEEQLGGGRGSRKRALRVEFGDGGPSVGLASASTTSSIQSSTGSFMRVGSSPATSGDVPSLAQSSTNSPSGSGPTAATAVSAYMAALKQRAAAAERTRDGGEKAAVSGTGESMHAASAPDAKSAVDQYVEGLKSRSAQAAVLRRMSSGSGSCYGVGGGGFAGSPFASQRGSVMSASLRSASGYPMSSSSLRVGSTAESAPPGLGLSDSTPAGADATPLAQLSVGSEKMSRLSLGSGSLRVPSLRGSVSAGSGGLQAPDDGGWHRRSSLGGNPGGLETLDETPSGELTETSPRTATDASRHSSIDMLRRPFTAEEPHKDSAASGNTQPGVGSKQLSPAIEPVHVAQQQTGAGTASDAAAPTADAE